MNARVLDFVLAGCALVIAIVMVVRAPAWTVDDAFIVARYADHAIAHGRLAFNLAGDRVEGFTSVLGMLIAIAARACGGDPIVAMKGAGVLAYLLSIPLLVLLGRALSVPPPAAGIVALIWAALPEHAAHAASGLETEVFVSATLLVVLAHTRGSLLLLALACTFATIVRPEGVLYAAFLIAACVRARQVRAAVVGFVVPLAVLTVARALYFHDVLPNTFYAKSGSWNLAVIEDTCRLVKRVFLPPAVAAVAALVVQRRRLRWPRQPVLLLALLVFVLQMVGYARSLPIMNYGHRFAFHAAGPLLVIAVVGIGFVVPLASSRVLVALGVFASLSASFERLPAEYARSLNYTGAMDGMYADATRWILANTADDSVLAVYPDAGVLPYRTRRTTIDFGRLNDRVLARAKNSDDVRAYFFEQAPELLVTSLVSGAMFDDAAQAIASDPRFADTYELSVTFTSNRDAALRIYRRRR